MAEQNCDYHQRIDPDADSFTVSLLRVVVCFENRPVVDLPPIAYSVDPDALEGILASESGRPSGGDVRVEFKYDGVRVKVSSTGDVWIYT